MEEIKHELESRQHSESGLTEQPANSSLDDPHLPASSYITTNASTDDKPLPVITDRLRVFADTAFRFIANANNETLGACAVGLCASTYLVLGRLGLVLIGAFGGVLLHATWDTGVQGGDSKSSAEAVARKRELGAEIARRTLEWRAASQANTSDLADASLDKVEASTLSTTLDFSDYQPATAEALTEFTDAVIRDYVNWWYAPILPDEKTFAASCRQTLVAFIHSFSNHVSRKRAADPFLDFLANSTSIVIVFLNELSTALKASQKTEPEEAIRTYLKYQPDSNLANVISAEQQERKLKMVADDILQNFLDSKTYNCAPAKSFLVQILSGLILQSTINTCSKPEWINAMIISMLEDGEPEIMKEIDAGVEDLEGKINKTVPPSSNRDRGHQRRMSRAEEAMQEAMREAQRMNEMIAEEEARRKQGTLSRMSESEVSTATTDAGIATPTSTDSAEKSVDDQIVFDSDGMPHTSPIKHTPAVSASTFTSFDQITSTQLPTALQTTYEPPAPSEVMLATPLTLQNATINIMDIGEGNDQVPLKQKPNGDMFIQIEPASSRFPGWMVTRQYATFEPLHETLRRIAVIAGVPDFANKYQTLPAWKGKSRASLVMELEQYLRLALLYHQLAESDAMKRFLEKDLGLEKAPSKNVLTQGGQALENVGKGFISALGQGGKGLQTGLQSGGKVFQTGGKAVLGGVTGVFGAVAGGVSGTKRPGLSTSNSSASISGMGTSTPQSARASQDLSRTSSDTNTSRHSARPLSLSQSVNTPSRSSTDLLRTSEAIPEDDEILNLPPPPDQIADDFDAPIRPSRPSSVLSKPSRPSTPTRSSRPTLSTTASAVASPSQSYHKPPPRTNTHHTPLTEEETRITLDLLFALLTDLLSGLSSSAWTFRLSLLSAAKSYLLRPANPQLESIRTLLQESVIDANLTSDDGIAAHIKKLRFNTLPTAEELELPVWKDAAKAMTADEKERLRVKARKLLVERGLPSALVAVVGQAPCAEALGKLFDCLQVEEVSRGLGFALLLQGIRAATQ